MKQGETYRRSYALENDDGSPVDLTGWTVRSAFMKGAITVLAVYVPTDLVNGQFDLVVSDTDTALMALGEWRTDVRLEDGGGDVVYTSTQTITVESRVTL